MQAAHTTASRSPARWTIAALVLILCVGAAACGAVTDDSASNGNVSLSWIPPETDAPVAGYRVYYGRASRDYDAVVDVGADFSYTAADLTPGTYYFAVIAYDGLGTESPYSMEVTVAVPR